MIANRYINKHIKIGRLSLHRRANNKRIRAVIFPKLKLENPNMSTKDLNSLVFRESSRLVTERFIDIQSRNTEEYQEYVRQEKLNNAEAQLLLDNAPKNRNNVFNHFKYDCYIKKLTKIHNLPHGDIMPTIVSMWYNMSDKEKTKYAVALKAKRESDDRVYLKFLATRGITDMDIESPATKERRLRAKKYAAVGGGGPPGGPQIM